MSNLRLDWVFALALIATASWAAPAVTVTVHAGDGPVNSFVPNQALGAAVDGYEQDDIAKIYTKANVEAMKSTGLAPITYRLRTELGIEAWHWNPEGRWSDPVHQCGYWTSSATSSSPIQQCNGYRLPRRGDTIDQANNSGYSRLDDGDLNTFWKSNPYLDRPFAPEDHPQWVLIELDQPAPIDTIQIDWAAPYATRYTVEYWQKRSAEPTDKIDETFYGAGRWQPFSNGVVTSGKGGREEIRLASQPIAAEFVRIRLLAGSATSLAASSDIRDRLGYAVREIALGRILPSGRFRDYIQRGPSNKTQTHMLVSSTDPWHRVTDIDRDVEQPGFDRIFGCGITRGLPVMIPAGVAYDNPDNAVAEIRYLRAHGYPVARVELGEEPDGQYMTPEDYGALYVEFARILHSFDPSLKLGGPSYQTMALDEVAWPDPSGDFGPPTLDHSWTRRFVAYLKRHDALPDLSFFSTECYFYDDVCAPTMPNLLQMPVLVDDAFARWKQEGVPTTIPWLVSEFGYSAFGGEPEVDLPGALLDADLIGHVLALGGSAVYFYGLEPNTLIQDDKDCDSWGNLALWHSDDDRDIKEPFAAYYAMRMVTQEWSEPGNGRVDVYRTSGDGPAVDGGPIVTSYAAHRPDGAWSILLINKDAKAAHHVRLSFSEPAGAAPTFAGPLDIYQYSRREYVWRPNGENGRATTNLPPAHWTAGLAEGLALPPYSITVVRTVQRH